MYEELIARVCKIPKTDQQMVGLVKDVGGWFNSYRYKFHISIVKLAEQFELANNNENIVKIHNL